LLSTNETYKRKNFDRRFLEALDDSLRQVFGGTTARMILSHLERNKGLKREEIPRKIGEFSSCLNELLDLGAYPFERLLTKFLCSKLQLEYDANPELAFADYIRKLWEKFEA